MGQIGADIAANTRIGLLYAERLLKDVTPAQFARFARPGGVEVRSNHAAFVLGHLALYPARVIELLGTPAGDAQPPESYPPVFRNGVDCVDDPAGTVYPPMAGLTAFFFSSFRRAVDCVAAAEDAAFGQPNPAEGRLRELLPTVGAVAAFYLGGHVQQHLGQLSAWRRMHGLPPA